MKRHPFNIAFLVATAIYMAVQFWLIDAFDLASGGATGALPVLGKYLMFIYVSAVLGLYAGVAWWIAGFARKQDRWIAFPAAFTILEYIRGNVYIGYPWSLVANVWSDNLVVMQTLSLVGAYGLGFITLLCAGALLTRHWRTATAIAASVVLFGVFRLAPDTMTDYKVRTIALANPGRDYSSDLTRYLRLAYESDADLVATPSGALETNALDTPGVEWQVRKVARARHIAIGVPRQEPDGGAAYNSLGVYSKDGRVATYDKIDLSPFGDRPTLWLPIGMFMNAERGKVSSGDTRAPIDIGGKTASPYICFESTFPGLRIGRGIDFILNIASDISVADGGKMQYSAARMNAVAEGVPVVRATEGGRSAIISPYGREVVAMNSAGVMDGVLPARLGRTLFSYTGNVLVLIIAAAVLVFAIRRARRSRAK